MIDFVPLSPLEKNALWIIMDPWVNQPDIDVEKHPYLNDINAEMINKIISYIPRLKHVLLSMDHDFKTFPELNHIHNIGYDCVALKEYIKSYDIKDIVYIGFHHGRCILHRNTGLLSLKDMLDDSINFYIKRDMVLTFPGDDPRVADKESLVVCRFISSSCI